MSETLLGAALALFIIVLLSLAFELLHKKLEERDERNAGRMDRRGLRQGLDSQSNVRDSSRARHPAGKGLPVRPRSEHGRED